MIRRGGSLLVVALLSLVAAACGGESERDEVVEALERGLLEDEDLVAHGITQEEARCTAEAQVESVGVERMRELSFGPEDGVEAAALTQDEIAALAQAMEDCIANVEDLLVEALRSRLVDEPDPAFPLTEDEADCVAEHVAGQLGLGRLIVAGTEGDGSSGRLGGLDEDELGVFADAYLRCTDVRARVLEEVASGGADDDVVACLDANITEDDLRQVLVAAFSAPDALDVADAESVLQPAVDACT